MSHRVIILKGDYSKREYDANTAGAACVWHQHMNSLTATPTYALMEVAEPTTAREMAVAREVAQAYDALLGGGLGDGDGVKVLKDGDRGEFIIDGNKEAYISEPLFVSNPKQAAWILKPENQKRIAAANVAVLKKHYPAGSLIALSVGHKYKTSSPTDRGAKLAGSALYEADVCEPIVMEMQRLLTEEATVAETPYWLIVSVFPTPEAALSFKAWCTSQSIACQPSGVAAVAHGNDAKSKAAEAEAERRGATCPFGRIETTQESWKRFSARTPLPMSASAAEVARLEGEARSWATTVANAKAHAADIAALAAEITNL